MAGILSGLKPGKDGKLPKLASVPESVGKGDQQGGESSLGGKDGSFHTTIGGKQEQHADIGSALMALAHHHAPGKHVHGHHSGGSVHTHGVNQSGEHDAQEHGSAEEAGQHMGNYLADEAAPPQHHVADIGI